MRKVLGAILATTMFLASSFLSSAHEDIFPRYEECGQYGRPGVEIVEEDIAEEERLGDMELMAQLVEAEAGNQSLEGKVLVAEVLLNRVADPHFPDTIEEVIFQKNQFAVTTDGAWEKAAWNMQESDYEAVEIACSEHKNKDVLYFSYGGYVKGTTPLFKVGDHCFSK